MSDPILEEITRAKVTLFFKSVFWGAMAMNLDPVDASKWCRSFTTDGIKFYYNRDFMKSLQRKEVVWVICHTVGHIIYDHLGRRNGRDVNRWGAATDYINNYSIEKELVEKADIAQRPKLDGVFYHEKYDDVNWTAEKIYKDLEENSITIDMTIDAHGDISEGDGGSEGKSVQVTIQGGPDGPPSFTEDDMAKLRDKIRKQIMTAARAAGCGKVPAAIMRMIKEFMEPQIDWVSVLEAEIQSTVKDDFTFLIPSKRSWSIPKIKGFDNGLGTSLGSGIILPGHNFKKTIDIAFVIDASGSMSDDMVTDGLSELKGIVELYADFRVMVWSVDTKIYNPKVFTPQNVDELLDYGLVGRGGTDFMENWKFMMNPEPYGYEDFKEPIEPDKLVFFTDGYDDTSNIPEWCDTLWIIHGNDNFKEPFGRQVKYEDKETRQKRR